MLVELSLSAGKDGDYCLLYAVYTARDVTSDVFLIKDISQLDSGRCRRAVPEYNISDGRRRVTADVRQKVKEFIKFFIEWLKKNSWRSDAPKAVAQCAHSCTATTDSSGNRRQIGGPMQELLAVRADPTRKVSNVNQVCGNQVVLMSMFLGSRMANEHNGECTRYPDILSVAHISAALRRDEYSASAQSHVLYAQ